MEALQKFDSERASKLSEIEENANKARKKNDKTDINIVNTICNKIRKELAKKLVGSRAGGEYIPFNVNNNNNNNED